MAAMFLMCMHGAESATMSWNNAAGGDWADDGNWATAAPGASDVAEFDLNSATGYTVTNVPDGTVNQLLRVVRDTVTLDLDTSTYSLTDLTAMIVGTNGTTGALEINGGTLQLGSKYIHVGYNADTYTTQQGTLVIDGTSVDNNGSGDSITQLRIGTVRNGLGTVTIRGGATINDGWGIRKLFLYTSRTGVGDSQLIIEGSGTEVVIGELDFGQYSVDDTSISRLIVSNGAHLVKSAVYSSWIGDAGPAILTVTGSGSLAELRGQVDPLYIGRQVVGRGIVQVLDGGTVHDGVSWASGGGNDHDTFYGNGGDTHGSLLVEGTDSHYRVDHEAAYHDTYFRTNCTLVVRDGGKVSSYRGSELVFEEGSSLGGDGRLEIGVQCSGTIKPGGTLTADAWYGVTSGAGTLTVTSNLTLTATARYDVELGGTGATEYDRVATSNDVALNGSIAVSLIDGFTYNNALGNRFTVLEAGGTLSGAFANAANGEWIETSNPGETFQVHYGAGSQYDANAVVLTTKPVGTLIIIR